MRKLTRCARCGLYGVHDRHHLPSPLNERRRTRDIVVPLCRKCHDWVQHTADGLRWERENLNWLYGLAIGYLAEVEGWDKARWSEIVRMLWPE